MEMDTIIIGISLSLFNNLAKETLSLLLTMSLCYSRNEGEEV